MTVQRLGLTVTALILALGACSSHARTEPLAEQEIQDPLGTLEQAEMAFAAQVANSLPATSTTMSGGGQCFFSGDENRPDPLSYCGPVRHLGVTTPVWHTVPLTVKADRDGRHYSVVEEQGFTAIETPPSGLHRPDDVSPAALEDLPEPDVPPFPKTNVALLLPEGSLDADASWETLEAPAVLNAPAATFRVTATAILDTVPSSLADSEDPVPYYRPADGQRITAWRLEVLDSVVPGPERNTWFGADGARDASARLSIPSGSQRLPVEDQSLATFGSESDTFTIDCTNGVPCDTRTGRYVLFVSTSDEQDYLTVSTDGQDQTLNLGDGAIESSVSTVADERPQLETRLSTTWPREVLTILTQDEADELGYDYVYSDVTLTYAGQLNSAYLSPFHWEGGWAEPGRAWLSIPIDSDPQQVSQARNLVYDRGATYTLSVGGETLQPAGVGTQTFDVPDDFTTGTFRYRPTGSVEASESPVAFEAEEGLTVEIAFEE